MLARNRIILAEFQLFGGGFRILLGYVEETGIRRALQFDGDSAWLRHGLAAFQKQRSKSSANGRADAPRAYPRGIIEAPHNTAIFSPVKWLSATTRRAGLIGPGRRGGATDGMGVQ